MASLPWFELDIDFSEHPKVMALCARLKEPLADAYVARLWAYCYRQATDRLEGEAGPAIVEMAARWRGKPGVLASAMLAVGILDQAGPDLIAHGVAERLGPHLEARKNAAVRQKRRRDKLAKEPVNGRDATGDVTRDVPGDVAPASRLYRDKDKYRDQKQEAAATRASARSDSPKLGSGAAEAATPPPAAEAAPEPGPSASPGTAEPAVVLEGAPTSNPTPAAVGHSAEAATPSTKLPGKAERLALDYPATEAVLDDLAAAGIPMGHAGEATTRVRVEQVVERLPRERAVAALKAGHARRGKLFVGWYLEDLTAALRALDEPAPKPLPLVDLAWLDNVPAARREEAHRRWAEKEAEIQRDLVPSAAQRSLAAWADMLRQEFMPRAEGA